MRRRTRPMAAALLAAALLAVPCRAAAQDDGMPVFFRDTLMGAGIGAFVGGLLLLTTEHKSDHWDYVAFGGLVGALGGLGYSVTRAESRGLVRVDPDGVHVGLPTPRIRAGGPGSADVTADILQVRY